MLRLLIHRMFIGSTFSPKAVPYQKCTTEYKQSCNQVCTTEHYEEKCENVCEDTPVENCRTEFEQQCTDVQKEVCSVSKNFLTFLNS